MIKFLIIFINHFTWSEETCETSLENGKLVERDAIYHLECDAGFAPNIQKFLCLCFGDSCVLDNKPICIEGSCDELPTIKNGTTSCNNQNNYGSKCTTVCSDGFVQTSKSKNKCDVRDDIVQWSNKPASCKAINKCPKVPELTNCIDKPYQPEDQCQCKPGYQAEKPPRCRCKDGVCKWSKNKTCLDTSKFIDYEEERNGNLLLDTIDMGEHDEPTEQVSIIQDLTAQKCMKSKCWSTEGCKLQSECYELICTHNKMILLMTEKVFNAGLRKVVLANSDERHCRLRRVVKNTFSTIFNGLDYNDYKHFDYGINMDLGACGSTIVHENDEILIQNSITRWDKLHALGINFGQDFRFGFTCKYKDTATIDTNLNVNQNELNNTDEVIQTVNAVCKLSQYTNENFQDKTQSAYLGAPLFFQSECDVGFPFNPSAETNVFYYLRDCVGGQEINGKPVGYPIILEGCYADLIHAQNLNTATLTYSQNVNFTPKNSRFRFKSFSFSKSILIDFKIQCIVQFCIVKKEGKQGLYALKDKNCFLPNQRRSENKGACSVSKHHSLSP